MTRQPKPQVEVLAATWHDPVSAAALLIFTKSTRLVMSPDGFDGILARCQAEPEWMDAELAYMANTIRSSWEFLDITFMISNVSRACAQQITRTRLASFAMQSQRVTDMTGATYHDPYESRDLGPQELRSALGDSDRVKAFHAAMANSISDYESLIEMHIAPEDARGVLPMNVHCNLVAKYNLRVLVDLIAARTSYRVQGEYQDVAQQMRELTLGLWPWTKHFLKPRHAIACDILEKLSHGIEDGIGQHDLMVLVAKVKDQIEG